MILPIVAYGDAVLKKVASKIDTNTPELQQLIANMFETMYQANGVGLAAPQVGKSLQLFVADATVMEDLKESGFKKVFINPEILEESGTAWEYEEGCLSIPGIRENVSRLPKVKIKYLDENFNAYTEVYEGIPARIIQHEYDHLQGKLFIDYLSPLKKQLLKGKLSDISKGKTDADYKMRFPVVNARR